MEVDILIIGAGLAGTAVARAALENGWSYAVIDPGSSNTASRVAAGLINPLVGKRLTVAAHTPDCLQYAKRFYQTDDENFLHPASLVRLFSNEEELSRYKKRLGDPFYEPWLGSFLEPSACSTPCKLGGFEIKGAHILDTTAYLNHIHEYLKQRGIFQAASLQYNELELDGDYVGWQDIQARFAIFAEGWQGTLNPWFGNLPYAPAKGEIISLDKALNEGILITRGKWFLKHPSGEFRVGSTFRWDFEHEEPEQSGVEELYEAIKPVHKLDKIEAATIRAGIRPGSKDGRPLVGKHPEQPRLVNFNGFGSRGSLFAPYAAKSLINHLDHNSSLPEWCDIKRCYKAR